MWFNLLKLDLSSISTQIQGDAEGKNINIDAEDKCRKKLINFQNKMLALGKRGKEISQMTHEKLRKEVPESVACKFVEALDKYFNNIKAAEFSNGKFIGPEYEDEGKIDENYEYIVWYHIHNTLINPVISTVFVLAHPEYAYHMAFNLKDPSLTNELKKLWEAS